MTITIRLSRWRLVAFRLLTRCAAESLHVAARLWSAGFSVLLPGTVLRIEIEVDTSQTTIRGARVVRK